MTIHLSRIIGHFAVIFVRVPRLHSCGFITCAGTHDHETQGGSPISNHTRKYATAPTVPHRRHRSSEAQLAVDARRANKTIKKKKMEKEKKKKAAATLFFYIIILLLLLLFYSYYFSQKSKASPSERGRWWQHTLSHVFPVFSSPFSSSFFAYRTPPHLTCVEVVNNRLAASAPGGHERTHNMQTPTLFCLVFFACSPAIPPTVYMACGGW